MGAVGNAAAILCEQSEGAGIDTEMGGGICEGVVGALTVAHSEVGVLIVSAAVEHAYLTDRLCVVVGWASFHAEHVLNILEVVGRRTGSEALASGEVAVVGGGGDGAE